MDSIEALATDERPVMNGMNSDRESAHSFAQRPVLLPECYENSPLSRDLEFLCDPRVKISDQVLLNIVAKYFFSYVHECTHDQSVSLAEINGLIDQYGRHMSLNEPTDDIKVMNSLRRWSFALDMLSNAPRTAHMLRSVALQKVRPEAGERDYVGLDLRSGSGILVLGAYIQARRNGYENIEIIGLERDDDVGKRTGELLKSLCLGRIVVGDALDAATYESIKDRDISFVSLDAVSPGSRPLGRGFYSGLFQALFRSAGQRLERTVFFPDGMIVYSRGIEHVPDTFQGKRISGAFRVQGQGILYPGSVHGWTGCAPASAGSGFRQGIVVSVSGCWTEAAGACAFSASSPRGR